jgi:hypothetical protein
VTFSRYISALLAVTLSGCSSVPLPPTSVPDPAAAIARSISIIRQATDRQPAVLKILFYGQSISAPQWTDKAMEALRAKYPNVTFDYRNMALGGWASQALVRTAARDVKEFHPDLIVFHVYGDHREYENIIRIFRSETAADVIIQTDHVTAPVEPVCLAGLHLRWSPPPGCTGHFYFTQNNWEEFMSSVWMPTMANKYHLAIEPRRTQWDAYLRTHHLEPKALLADAVHPNPRGWTLMAQLFTSWFTDIVDKGAILKPLDAKAVQEFAPPKPGTRTRYQFDGTRIELLSTGPLSGKIRLTVDGKAPKDLDGCWQNSRVTYLSNVPDWPALKQVSVKSDYRRADTFTLTVKNLNASQNKFNFTLVSKHLGPDGEGTADSTFKSRSGNVSIEPGDWMIAEARQVSNKGIAEGANLTWQRFFACGDQAPITLKDGSVEQRYVVATGLSNGPHLVEIELASDAPAVRAARAYRPSLLE